MKKTAILILSLTLCLCLLASCGKTAVPAETGENKPAETAPTETAPTETAPTETAPAETSPAGRSPFVGQWSDTYSQRAYLTVLPTEEENVFFVTLHWGDTAASYGEWNMTAVDNGSDLQYSDGSRSCVTLFEDKDPETRLEWDGSHGRFYFEDDLLRWEDDKEESDEDVRFERIVTYAPDAETIAEQYLRPAASIPVGTSGAALQEAQAACGALTFANMYVLWSGEPETLRANFEEAWKLLSDEERAAFSENYDSLCRTMDGAFENWTDNGGLFEDAGVGEEMRWLCADRSARESWSCLKELTDAVCKE